MNRSSRSRRKCGWATPFARKPLEETTRSQKTRGWETGRVGVSGRSPLLPQSSSVVDLRAILSKIQTADQPTFTQLSHPTHNIYKPYRNHDLLQEILKREGSQARTSLSRTSTTPGLLQIARSEPTHTPAITAIPHRRGTRPHTKRPWPRKLHKLRRSGALERISQPALRQIGNQDQVISEVCPAHGTQGGFAPSKLETC